MPGIAGSANDHLLTVALTFDFDAEPIILPGLSSPSKVYEIWRGDFDGAYEEADGGATHSSYAEARRCLVRTDA